jgi:hypothetical protein
MDSRRLGTCAALSAAALLAAATAATPARAQELGLAGVADVATGLAGGGRGHAAGVRRARTLIRAGAEAWVNESPKDRLGAMLLLELEPHTAAGVDLRYVRLLTDRFTLQLGGVAMFVPSTLVGATVAADYRLPIKPTVALTATPSIQVFFLGNDLPSDTVLWQGLLHVGVHVDFL